MTCLQLQLEAFLLVCAQTWQPQRMCLKVCGQPEMLTYQGWSEWENAHTRSANIPQAGTHPTYMCLRSTRWSS